MGRVGELPPKTGMRARNVIVRLTLGVYEAAHDAGKHL